MNGPVNAGSKNINVPHSIHACPKLYLPTPMRLEHMFAEKLRVRGLPILPLIFGLSVLSMTVLLALAIMKP